MKRILLLLFVLFTVISLSSAQKKQLILVHPTAYNLQLFTYLVDNNIVNINDLEISGIYHSKERYDYSKAEKFLSENDYPYIKLEEISGELLPENLFSKNGCTQFFDEIFSKSKGVIFFGGPDFPPAIYGERMSLLTRMTDPYRHYFESSFLFHLLGGSQNDTYKPLLEKNPDYVVYGFCLGMQTMNIACGGSMIQDIPSEIYRLNTVEGILNSENAIQHRNYNNNLVINSTLTSGNFHKIKISNQKAISGDYKPEVDPLTYSNHHQAVEKLGKNLNIAATSLDEKVIEAVTHEKYPNVLGLQFHPEGTYLYNSEIQLRKNPNDSLISGKELLIKNGSYKFHLAIWETFSKKINKE